MSTIRYDDISFQKKTHPTIFMELPHEIMLLIFSHLDAESLCHMSCVCRRLCILASDDVCWVRLCNREWEYNTFFSELDLISWKSRYMYWLRASIKRMVGVDVYRRALYNNEEEIKALAKVVLLGGDHVGKSSLVKCFQAGRVFPDGITPMRGFPIHTVSESRQKSWKITLQMWEVTGQKRFRWSICRTFITMASAIVLVFSVIDLESLDMVEYCAREARKNVAQNSKPPCLYLVANKVDLEDSRLVSREKGIALAEKLGVCGFYEISCTTGDNAERLFRDIAHNYVDHVHLGVSEVPLPEHVPPIATLKKKVPSSENTSYCAREKPKLSCICM